MSKIKTEVHHWWPKGVSQFWKDPGGMVHRLSPNGEDKPIPPKSLGGIGNGHTIKIRDTPHDFSGWDMSFEDEFQRADDRFPFLIPWLKGLETDRHEWVDHEGLFAGHAVADDEFSTLVESIVSLAVRSPMTREAAVSLAEERSGPLSQNQRMSIIGFNLRGTHKDLTKSFGAKGKCVVVFSPFREFIFGDGFFHNIRSPAVAHNSPKIFVPLTPNLAVLYVNPPRYRTEPKLMSYIATGREVDEFNQAIQVYARSEIYYRQEKPKIYRQFEGGKHLVYSNRENPIDFFYCESARY